MTIGAALLLIAAGAVLRFAISTSSLFGINLYVIGDILMGVGALGLVLWLVVWLPRTRSRRTAYEPPPEVPPRARDPYRTGERYPEDRYPQDGYPASIYPGDRSQGESYPTRPYPQDPRLR